jgi:ADP-heptose:LPS heptosyltransferase
MSASKKKYGMLISQLFNPIQTLNVANELNEFRDTAAWCELMDFVIGVDTSVAHLAGALGNLGVITIQSRLAMVVR